MNNDEQILDYLEQHIPELAIAATQQAYWRALAFGGTVILSENNNLVEKFPDGTQKIIKITEPWIRIEPAKIVQLK
jgi:hypothetical protein